MWRWLRPKPEVKAIDIDTLIKPPIPLHVGHDEAKAVQAQLRRDHADAKRREAAQIQSGQGPVPKLILFDREARR